MKTRVICLAVRVAFVMGVLALGSIARAQTPSLAEATDLQKQFEAALTTSDAKMLGEFLADDSTIVFARYEPLATEKMSIVIRPQGMGPFTKAAFLAQIPTPPLNSKLDTESQTIVLRDGSFVASWRENVPMATGYFCSGVCFSIGPGLIHVDMTAVWAQVSGRWRVVLLETYFPRISPSVSQMTLIN
jgi:hypothetical protein